MRRVIVIVFVLLAANIAPSAHAANCASIAERECPPLPRVTFGRDLRVEIVTRKRKLFFNQPRESEYFPPSACPNDKCECDEFVQHLDFKGPVPGFARVNELEYRTATQAKCSAANTNVTREVVCFAVTKRTVSTAIYNLEYCRGCGGSCHGHTTLTSYDAKTGATLTVRDAAAPAKLDDLRTRIVEDFLTANFDASYRDGERKRLGDEVARALTLDSGLYAEPGKLFLNFDTFALSCAQGSFHPVAIPPEFLTPAFRARLKS